MPQVKVYSRWAWYRYRQTGAACNHEKQDIDYFLLSQSISLCPFLVTFFPQPQSQSLFSCVNLACCWTSWSINNAVWTLSFLDFFTQYVLENFASCCMYQWFTHFTCWVAFYCVIILHFVTSLVNICLFWVY